MANPTIESTSQQGLPPATPPQTLGDGRDERTIVNNLLGYFNEADNARKGGLNNRDDKWEKNLNLYWNRYDWTAKAEWQAKETMPEVSSYVDRFAAALKEAMLTAGPGGFYTVVDPADREGDLTQAVKNMTDTWLSRSGRNQMGQLLSFSSVFEEQVKLGALMAMSSVVTWKEDVPGGRVAIETVDPRFVWLDPTYRNLYRIRRVELDRYDLYEMAKAEDSKGKPLFNLPEIQRLMQGIAAEDQNKREQISGHGQNISTGRAPVVLDEYIATVLDAQGNVIADKGLFVVANKQFLIRGPEANPFWHGSDWLTYTPLITVPLSVYGRSYMEDFASVASTFTELTNMILDAVHAAALKVYVVVPSILRDPGQAAQGLSPGKTFFLEEGFRPDDFATAIDMGTLPPDVMKMWQEMKSELSEAAGMNEIGLGQFAPKGRTSATEVNQTMQSSSAIVRGVAQTIEQRWLAVTLDLTWKTGLQHARANDPILQAAAGDFYPVLLEQRKDLIKRPITFQANGISTLIRKGTMLKALMGILTTIGSNELLMQEFLKAVSLDKFVKMMFELSDIDITKLQSNNREQLIRSVTEPLNGMINGQAPTGQGGARREMQSVANAMGVAK